MLQISSQRLPNCPDRIWCRNDAAKSFRERTGRWKCVIWWGARAEPLDSVRSARIGGYGSVIYRRGGTEMMSWELDDLRHRRHPTVPTCDVYSP